MSEHGVREFFTSFTWKEIVWITIGAAAALAIGWWMVVLLISLGGSAA